MGPAITDANFGAWLIKCNAETWDFRRCLDEEEYPFIGSWSLVPNYRSRLMKPGDPIVFWVSGTPAPHIPGGIWGVGEVIGDVEEEVTLDPDPGLWKDEEARRRSRHFVLVDIPLWDSPLDRNFVREHPILGGMEVIRMPQGSNPSWLNREEWEALKEYLVITPSDPTGEVMEESVEEAAEEVLAVPDPETRRAIESAAVDAVLDWLGDNGWELEEDVQTRNLGWDLTATCEGATALIEVKGRAPVQPDVFLSPNELRAARDVEGWELAIVSNALVKPRISWHLSEEVVELARPALYRFRPSSGAE